MRPVVDRNVVLRRIYLSAQFRGSNPFIARQQWRIYDSVCIRETWAGVKKWGENKQSRFLETSQTSARCPAVRKSGIQWRRGARDSFGSWQLPRRLRNCIRRYFTAYVKARHWTRSSKPNILGDGDDGRGIIRFANKLTEIRFASHHTHVLYFVSPIPSYNRIQFTVHSVPKDSPQSTRDFRKTSQTVSFIHKTSWTDK